MHKNGGIFRNETTSKKFSELTFRPENVHISRNLTNNYFLADSIATWHGTSPHYMKKCMRNCNPTVESEILLDHFHNDDIENKQHIFTISIVLTMVTIASAIFFLAAKLKLGQRNQSAIQRTQSQ